MLIGTTIYHRETNEPWMYVGKGGPYSIRVSRPGEKPRQAKAADFVPRIKREEPIESVTECEPMTCPHCKQTFTSENDIHEHVALVKLNADMVRRGRPQDRDATGCVLHRGDAGDVKKILVVRCGEQNWVGAELARSQFRLVKT